MLSWCACSWQCENTLSLRFSLFLSIVLFGFRVDSLPSTFVLYTTMNALLCTRYDIAHNRSIYSVNKNWIHVSNRTYVYASHQYKIKTIWCSYFYLFGECLVSLLGKHLFSRCFVWISYFMNNAYKFETNFIVGFGWEGHAENGRNWLVEMSLEC